MRSFLSNTASGSTGTVGGGSGNIASGTTSTVGGGSSNFASGLFSTVGGGNNSAASGRNSTVAGGGVNTASGGGSAVGGGAGNTASGGFSTVGGGISNTASGDYSFAAGRRAKTQTPDPTPAQHDGVFVWADSNDADFNSISANEFASRATGGVRFVTAIDGAGLPTWTCGVSGGAGGSWGCTSDRDAKTELVALDGVATLDRLAALPVYQWAAKDDPRRTPHAGPTAQDFMAAFGLGDNDMMIGFADAQGVAFAAIQGLNAKLDLLAAQANAEGAGLRAENTALKREMAELRASHQKEIADLRLMLEVLLARTSRDGHVAQTR